MAIIPTSPEEHYNYTFWEWNNQEYFKKVIDILKNNNIQSFIDLGANSGGVYEVLKEQIPSLKYSYLIEPEKDNFKYLFDKYKFNTDVFLLNCGIFYGKTFNFLIREIENHTGGYSVIHSETESRESDKICQLFELEFFNFKPIDFIKIDIERAEYNIIENSVLLKTINFIDIELHVYAEDEELVNYFKHHLPNHQIILIGYDNCMKHVLLQKVI